MAKEHKNDEVGRKTTFVFPILDKAPNFNMRNISPSILPNFLGMALEDPNAFLFEFDVLCCSYNYMDDSHKLNLFPTTLKYYALRWFMGLRENNIRSCDDMNAIFL